MGEYCVYFRELLIGNICDNQLLIKQTETSKRVLQDCPSKYPYEGSRTLMFVADCFEDTARMTELLTGMFQDLAAPSKK